MEALEQWTLALALVLKLFTLYFVCVAVFTLRRRRAYPKAPPRTRFAVVVAARNEERVIAQLVDSILEQRYPARLRDIYVVPNNCTDYTEAVAAAAGAKILQCLSPVHSKGGALHQALGQLMGKNYDAFVVFDADNVVHPDFLARCNDAILAGARVCKGQHRAGNPGSSAVAGCYGLYFTSFDWVFNRPRAALGLSAKLVGTGFVIHREVLERLGGWNTSTIAEDAEFAAQCAAAGYRVHWVPEAVTYDEAPTRFSLSLRQRKRWCSGVMQVGRQEVGRLWSGGSANLFLRLDMTMFLLAPFAQAVSGLLLAVNALLFGDGYLLLPMALAGYCAMALGGMLLCLLGRYRPEEMLGAVLLFPLFMASWLPLQVLSLFHDTTRWHAIQHEGQGARLPTA